MFHTAAHGNLPPPRKQIVRTQNLIEEVVFNVELHSKLKITE